MGGSKSGGWKGPVLLAALQGCWRGRVSPVIATEQGKAPSRHWLPLDRQPPSTAGSPLARPAAAHRLSLTASMDRHLPRRERAAAMRVSAFQIPVSKWWQKEAPPNVIHIGSVQQLVDAMVGAAAAATAAAPAAAGLR